MRRALFIAAITAVSLSGCGSFPKTPDLLVENAKGEKMFSEKDVFEVKKPLPQVTALLRKRSAECLQQDVTVRAPRGSMMATDTHRLTPKVEVTKNRTRMTMQKKTITGLGEMGDIPPDGWYILVVDAYAKDKTTTRVESYFQFSAFKGAFTAIKPWMTDPDAGCPDLTQ